MRRNPIWPILITLAGLAVVLLLQFNRSWVQVHLVEPARFTLWSLKLMLLSIPQAFYWGVLSFLAITMLLYALRPSFPSQATPVQAAKPLNASHLAQWSGLVSNMDSSRFASDTFARDLVRLSVAVLSYQEDQPVDEIYERINNRTLDLAEDFQAFLERREFQNKPNVPNIVQYWFRRIFRRQPDADRPLSAIDLEASRMLAHVEYLLDPQSTENLNV